MTRSFASFLISILFVVCLGCSEFEKPTEPPIVSDKQLVNPIDSTYVADSLAPPAPKVWIESIKEGLRVRFNGQLSETTPDAISGVIDFEGYRIRTGGRNNLRGSWPVLASYDFEDYDKWVYVPDSVRYKLLDIPYSLDSLRCLYADSCDDLSFIPNMYTRSRPFVHPGFPDSVFWFEDHDFNVSEMGYSTPIRKVYPDEPDPSTLPIGSLTLDRFTENGYLKFYEYEYIIKGMYPNFRYWVNVTAFDFGYAPLGIEPSETDHWSGAIGAYPRIR